MSIVVLGSVLREVYTSSSRGSLAAAPVPVLCWLRWFLQCGYFNWPPFCGLLPALCFWFAGGWLSACVLGVVSVRKLAG